MANLLSPIRQCSSEMSENVDAAPANNFFTQTYRIEREVDDDENIASRGMMTTLMSFSKVFFCVSRFFSVKVDRTQSDNNKLSLIAKWLITEINLRENLVKEKRLFFFPSLYCGRYFFVVVVYFPSAIVGCLLFIVWLPLITLCVTLVKEHALFLFLLFMHNGVMTAERAQEQPAILHPFLTFHKSSGWREMTTKRNKRRGVWVK